ncbi:MAG: threonine aldolase family protein [Maricaulaceae bacterium]
MKKYSFMYDYSEGAHPNILRALSETNLSQQAAYGADEYCEQAKALIHTHLKMPEASIYFVASGTLANLIIIASLLRPHEAVIAAQSGHIAAHETGAIEATGHKIITMPSGDGKLTPADIDAAIAANSMAPHMAKPRLVYISNATETGRVYNKLELTALSKTCRENGLLLMLDGARLGAALTAEGQDLTLADIAALTDVFWIGGTKAGALIGEAIVINPARLPANFAAEFPYHVKQRGALLAKGRLLGLQFRELFKGDLYFETARHANTCAQDLSKGLAAAGYQFSAPAETNQIFPILPNDLVDRLEEKFSFYRWAEHGADHTVLRLVTSWATPPEKILQFINSIK